MPFDDPAQPTTILGGGGGPPPVGDTDPPAAPTGLVATAGNTQVSLGWLDNTETDLDRYRVCRATVPGGPYTLIATVTVSEYVATGLSNGTAYYFIVIAVDDFGNESVDSAEVSSIPVAPPGGDVTPPAVPTGLVATAGDRQISLNWDNSGASDFANFKVYRAPSLAGSYVLIVTRTVSDYINTGLTNGTPYYYKVSAVDSSGNESAQSSAVTATPVGVPGDTTPPAAPTGLTATASDRAVALDWADSGAGDFSHYRVYRSLTSGGSYSFIATRTVSNHTDGTLTNGITYFYRVTTVDISGNESVPSSVVSATPVSPPVPPPSGGDGYPTYANRQVTINVGDNFTSVITSHPVGTLFGIAPGVHLSAGAAGQFAPRNGERLVGQIDSNGVPTSILRGNWDQTQNGGGIISPFPFANSEAYSSNVQFLRIKVELYAQSAGGTINGGPSWYIHKCWIGNNKTAGVRLGHNATIFGSKIYHNGKNGLYCQTGSVGGTVDSCEIYEANYAGWHSPLDEAGGLKFISNPQPSNMIIRRSHVHHNNGPGIWYDFNLAGALIEDNLCENNVRSGIFYELSTGSATIRRNLCRANAKAGIHISNSRGTSGSPIVAEDNVCADTNGFLLVDEPTRSPRLGYVTIRRNRVHQSTGECVSQLSGAPVGIVINENRYFTNTSNAWRWLGSSRTWPQWQGLGFDTIGSTSAYVAA